MAIKPSSDIVLEVLKAADPARVEAATQRLVALGAGGPEAADDFARALDAAEPPSLVGPAGPSAAGMRDRLARIGISSAADQKAARVEVEFEASMLKTFVEAILPKDQTSFYGQGTAGDIWKSMLADQIARQIAKSGAFGISKRLFATHPLPGQAVSAAASTLAAQPPLAELAAPGAAFLSPPHDAL
jgi:peptidoglycan hydrolase FlgJ